MIPAAFDYAAPTSLDEAIDLLSRHGDDAKLLAGGHSLLPLMKLRLAVPEILIDLGNIASLRYIREDNGHIAIGAMTTYAALEESDLVRRQLPLLAQATGHVGDTQVRNRGTLGGALAHADPAGDMPAVTSALDGSVIALGPSGTREIPLSSFFVDIFTSALRDDEILTEVRLRPQMNAAGHYEKFRKRQIDWAIIAVAANVRRSGDTIDDVRVVLTNAGPRPMHATSVENALRGTEPSRDAIKQAAQLAADDINPSSELAGTAEYKRHLACVLTERAISIALDLN